MQRQISASAALIGFVLGTSLIFTVARPAPAGLVPPPFSPANFVPGASIDNPYYPLKPGTVFHYAATVTDSDTRARSLETSEDAVTSRLENVGGVLARVVHARTWHDNVQIEDTTDFFAQDKSGNVWYLGEDTTAFQFDPNGKLTGTSKEGSWRTGVHGGVPGFIMPAHPTVGLSYYQEFSPADQAVDQAQVTSLDRTISVPAGSFSHVLETLETSAVEPTVRETKLYAPGVGLVVTNDMLDENGVPLNRIPLVSVTTSSAVPLPNAAKAALLTMPLVLLAALARRPGPRRDGA